MGVEQTAVCSTPKNLELSVHDPEEQQPRYDKEHKGCAPKECPPPRLFRLEDESRCGIDEPPSFLAVAKVNSGYFDLGGNTTANCGHRCVHNLSFGWTKPLRSFHRSFFRLVFTCQTSAFFADALMHCWQGTLGLSISYNLLPCQSPFALTTENRPSGGFSVVFIFYNLNTICYCLLQYHSLFCSVRTASQCKSGAFY